MKKNMLNYIKSDNIINKITITYFLIFIILICFSLLNLYNIDSVSFKTYLCIGVMTLFTILGMNIVKRNIDLNYKKIKITIKEKHVTNFLIGVAIICLFYLIKYLYLIRNVPITEIRLIRYSSLFSCGAEYVFFNYILTNMIVILEIVFCLNLFSKTKYLSKTNSLLAIIIFIVYSLIGFSRMGMLNIIIAFGLSLILFNDKKFSFKELCKYVLIILLLTFMLSLVMVYFRTGTNIKSVIIAQIKQAYVYLLGPFRAFDQLLINGFDNLTKSYGRATFGGFDEMISYFLSFIGISVKSYNEYLGNITQTEIIIGKGISFNAFYTSAMNYYIDLGYAGIIAFSFLDGVFLNWILRLKKTLLCNKVLITFVLMNLFKTFLNWPYQHGMNLFLLIILVLIALICELRGENIGNGIYDTKINKSLKYTKQKAVILKESSYFNNYLIFTLKNIIKHTILYFKNFDKDIINKGNIDFNTELEGKNVINKNTNIYKSQIGYGTYIGEKTNIFYTKIGKFCSIANNVKIICFRHPTTKFISTHPAFYSNKKQAGFTFVEQDLFEERIRLTDSDLSVEIGNDVWIGENVIIMGGVKIGDGAIIGANSLITKDIEPYSINVGSPTKKIKYRFDENDRNYLLKLKWWDKSIKEIRENALYFNDVDKLRKCSKWKDQQ